MRLITDLFAYCAERIPQLEHDLDHGYHIREAGSTAVQELAFTLANGIAYVRGGRRGGPRRRRVRRAPVVLLQRAQRLLRGGGEVPRGAADLGADHARALRRDEPARAGAALPRARPAARRSPRSSRRTTSSASRSRRWRPSLGGAQSLHTNGYDEALALPTERAGAHRAAHAADPRRRDRRRRHGRPARRLLLRRGADRRARGARAGS